MNRHHIFQPQSHSTTITWSSPPVHWERHALEKEHAFPVRPTVIQHLQKLPSNKTVFLSLFEDSANADLYCPGYLTFRALQMLSWQQKRVPFAPAQPFCEGPMEEEVMTDIGFKEATLILTGTRNTSLTEKIQTVRFKKLKLISSLTSFASCKIPSMISSHFPSKVKTFHSGWNCNSKCC